MIPTRLRAVLSGCLCAAIACSGPRESSAAGDVAHQGDDELERAMAADPVLRDAVKAIDAGHPWKATVAVWPRLASPRTRSRAVVLVAARAAADWEGWTEVEKLLASETWLDSAFNGEARELLARAALERNAGAAAIQHAEAAVRAAGATTLRPARLVYLARALDREENADSAASLYRDAARSLPIVADWLHLRAAGADRDAAARARAFALVRSPVARERVSWTEAQARERFGDLAGASDRFAALGARVSAFRLRMAMAPDSVARLPVKDSLIGVLRGNPPRDDARQIVQILEGAALRLTPADELEIGRALATPGPLPRAIAGFERANRARLLRPDDRLQYGLALSRAGRAREALAQLDSVREPANVAARAAYQRARIVMSSRGSAAAIPALRSVADAFASNAENASAALYLLADLSTDAGSDETAIATYRELYREYPGSARADDARFRAAILDLAHGRAKAAALAFDSIVGGFPNSNERTAARYWSGRAWKAAGDTRRATATWEGVIADQPSSYYSLASARRLGREPWKPAAAAETFPPAPAVDAAFDRIKLLRELGMDAEARFELEALEEGASASKELALTTAAAFRAHGYGPKTIRLATRLIEQGERDARVYRLAFPLIDREELERHARANGLDAALVAGLIKQESAFDPRALSVANARGLMQVLPSVGAEVARARRFPVWSPSLLYDADVNLQIGTLHLAGAVKQYDDIVRVLAAYNAGDSRVQRWAKKTATDDPELFAEQIPFVETRDYVRIVQRNTEMYRLLYGLK